MSDKPVTIQDQADFMRVFVARSCMMTGETPDTVVKYLSRDEVEFMRGIADRLACMAPHEDDIRRIVTGRR